MAQDQSTQNADAVWAWTCPHDPTGIDPDTATYCPEKIKTPCCAKCGAPLVDVRLCPTLGYAKHFEFCPACARTDGTVCDKERT